ncbi:uncharacterized protein EI90DRAFT_2271893 [Cantharellus anzutake]|uniref:uncharacterized protein n=1 Tax=Cantharellus anzutake TaxID=1750568 RepID=UPI001903E532|nr:uncharacterized protein EI90DRAFT_2271893 [Cantharellus anzutake]KAF8339710.1 hypothetical protein EI90DRAFT_2271893 [Cantharellus anzutake]
MESLHDGRRLENIAWRLLHREMSIKQADRRVCNSGPEEAILTAPLVPGSPLSPLSSETESDEDDISTAVDDDELLPGPSSSSAPPPKSTRSHSSTSRSSRRRRMPVTTVLTTSAHPPRTERTGQQLSASQPSAPGSTRISLDSHHRTLSAPHRLSSGSANPTHPRNNPTRSSLNIGKVISTLLPEKVDIPRSPRVDQPISPHASTNSTNSSRLSADASSSPASRSNCNCPHTAVCPSTSQNPSTSVTDPPVGVCFASPPFSPSSRSVLVANGAANPALILTNPTPRVTPPATPSRASTTVSVNKLESDRVNDDGICGNDASGRCRDLHEEQGPQRLAHPTLLAVPFTSTEDRALVLPRVAIGSRLRSSSDAAPTEPDMTLQTTKQVASSIPTFSSPLSVNKRSAPPRAIPRLLASPFSQPIEDPSPSSPQTAQVPASVDSSNAPEQAKLGPQYGRKIFFIQRTPPGEDRCVVEGTSINCASKVGLVLPTSDTAPKPMALGNPAGILNLATTVAAGLLSNDSEIEALAIQTSSLVPGGPIPASNQITSVLGNTPTPSLPAPISVLSAVTRGPNDAETKQPTASDATSQGPTIGINVSVISHQDETVRSQAPDTVTIPPPKLASSFVHAEADGTIPSIASYVQPKLNFEENPSPRTERKNEGIATDPSPPPMQTSCSVKDVPTAPTTQIPLPTSRSHSVPRKGKQPAHGYPAYRGRGYVNGGTKHVRLAAVTAAGNVARPGLPKQSSSSSANLMKKGVSAKTRAKGKEGSDSMDSKSQSRSPGGQSRAPSTSQAKGPFVASPLSNGAGTFTEPGESRGSGSESVGSKKRVLPSMASKKSSPADGQLQKPPYSHTNPVQNWNVKRPLPGRSYTIANISRLEPALEPHAPQPQPSTQTSVPRGSRRPVIDATSSDSETTSDDGSSWSDVTDEDEDFQAGNQRSRASQDEEETGHIAREAALEVTRQREMFRKLPSRSYSNLGQRRQSGLLSTLLNPDPAILPYLPTVQLEATWRPHNSAQNLGRRPPALAPLGALQPMTTVALPAAGPSRPAAPPLKPSKSAAEVRLAQVSVTNQVAVNPSGRPGYRLKGRPEGEEVESDDEEDDQTLGLEHMSKSVAQRRLEALAQKDGRNRAHQALPNSSSQQPDDRPGGQPDVPSAEFHVRQQSQDFNGYMGNFVSRPQAVPLALPHPYNLPPPPPPQTPRTTRRVMMANEMSESLRRNLLWERQLSRRMLGNFNRQRTERDEEAERQRRELTRTRSWADDYHASGW